MASRPPLTPQSAEITTATVAIKALTVNGKQVTLAVFRQLYEEPLYDDSRTWKAFGTPWCRVNYHPDRCDRDPVVHEHMVWQKPGLLQYHSLVGLRPRQSIRRRRPRAVMSGRRPPTSAPATNPWVRVPACQRVGVLAR